MRKLEHFIFTKPYIYGINFVIIFILLICIGIPGCTKDDEPEPMEELTTVGVRLKLDSIVCEKSWGDGTIELYGAILANAEYDYSHSADRQHGEKFDKALLWYRAPKDWARFYEKSHNKSKTLKIDAGFIDFFCDITKQNECDITIQPILFEFDGGNEWGHGGDENDISKIIDIADNKQKRTMAEYVNSSRKNYQLHLSTKNDKGEMVLHYSVYQIPVKSEVKYPAGKGPGEIFIEADQDLEFPRGKLYSSTPPAQSEKIVIGQIIRNTFSPEPITGIFGPTKAYNYNLRPQFFNGENLCKPMFESKYLSTGPKDTHYGYHEEPWKGLVYKNFNRATDTKTEEQLSKKPYIQLIKYWQLQESNAIIAGISTTFTKVTTNSIERTKAYELSITLGFEVGDIFGCATFSTEIQNTFSTSVSYTESTEYSISKTIGPYDTNVRYNIWQEIHELRIVDEKGEVFTDPEYEFKSINIGVLPTSNVVGVVEFY